MMKRIAVGDLLVVFVFVFHLAGCGGCYTALDRLVVAGIRILFSRADTTAWTLISQGERSIGSYQVQIALC